MKRTLVALPLAVLAASAAPVAHASAAPVAPHVLYRSDFAHKGIKGWTTINRFPWHVNHKGIVTFDGSNTGELVAPFSTTGIHDFSITATLKQGGSTSSDSLGYGLEVRGPGPTAGILAASFVTSDRNTVDSGFLWGTDSLAGSQVTLYPGFNTYRLDVHRTDYTMYINGQKTAQFTIPEFSSGTQVGIWSYSYKLQLKSFTVRQLPTAAPLPAQPPLKAINLGSSDEPASLTYVLGEYITGAALASVSGSSPDSARYQGLVLAYATRAVAETVPDAGPYEVTSFLFAYSSPDEATAGLQQDWSAEQQASSTEAKVTSGDLTGLGDEAHWISYDVSALFGGSIPATEVRISFRRSPYEAELVEDFVGTSMTRTDMVAATTSLAKTVDGRIQAQPATSV